MEIGPDGLIDAVHVNGASLSVKQYMDHLMQQRVQLWYEHVENPDVADITRNRVESCVSVMVDRRTGLIAETHNNLFIKLEKLHPLVRQRVLDYMHDCEEAGVQQRWGTPYAHPSQPGEHSEVYAASQLLWAREAMGIPVDARAFAELRMNNYFPWLGGGKPAPCCANCARILYDVPCNLGKLPVFRGDPSTAWEE